MKNGQKVIIKANELQPEVVGKIGTIVYTYPNNLYQVSVGGKILKGYATEDCLEPYKGASND